MTGSKRWFVYVTDAGTSYGLFADESNTEAVNPAADVVPPPVNIEYSIPRNVIPRYALYRSEVSGRTAKCYVLKPAQLATVKVDHPSIPDTLSAGTGTLLYKNKKPELIKPTVIAEDTAIKDGDTETAPSPPPA